MRRLMISLILCLVITTPTFPGIKGLKSDPNKTVVNFAQRMVQGYNMRVWLSNQMTMGLQAWDAQTGTEIPEEPHYGLEYPKGSGIEHLFGAGPRIGGIVNGVRRVDEGYNGQDGRKEFLPELRYILREHFWRTHTGQLDYDPIGYSGYYYNHGITVNTRGCDNDGDGKVNEDDLDGVDNDGDWNLITDDVGSDGLPDSIEASCDGVKYDPVSNPDPAGDDYDSLSRDKCHPNPDGSFPLKSNKDIWTEKNGIPDHGEPHVDEDYGAVSDNDLYCSATDTFHSPIIPGHVRMGIKVIQKSYAWQAGFAEAILPFDYYFVNIGQYVIRDIYVGFFADMDIGPTNVSSYPGNNYAAYMDSLHTAFMHNPIDRGSTPLGLTLLGASRPLDSLRIVFQWSDFTTRPDPGTNDSVEYCWMSGEQFPTQPIAPNQSPAALSDGRIFFSFGPFAALKPRDTLKISVALVSGYAIAEGPNNLVDNVKKAMMLYQRGYRQPVVPPSPSLKVVQGIRSATIKWGRDAGPIDPTIIWDDSNKLVESYPPGSWRRINPPCNSGSAGCSGHVCDAYGNLPGGRTFSGYRLYRSEDPSEHPLASSFALIKQYVIPENASEIGKVEWDSVFVDTNLSREKRYWYSVTSYCLPDMLILTLPQLDGTVKYDTVYSEGRESDILENATRVDIEFTSSNKAGEVLVVPNPYRTDNDYTSDNKGWEGRPNVWTEYSRLIKFIHLPEGEWTIRVYTISGDVVATLENHAGMSEYRQDRGELSWNLLSESGKALASGLYVFTVESKYGQQIGKFVVIR